MDNPNSYNFEVFKDMKESVLLSALSNAPLRPAEAIPIDSIREAVFLLIKSDYPTISKVGYISLTEMNKYRRKYLSQLIHQERGELAALDRSVFHSIEDNTILSENIEEGLEGQLTFGQKVADKIAEFGGSWTFIIFFFCFLISWIILNFYILSTQSAFDPFPFILLNLILSCLAAIQAPIIMMSQNRQEQKDRKRSEHDYKINLKAELEIQLLNEKIDYLIVQHNQKLLEIQELQTDYLEDLMRVQKEKD